MYFFTLIDKGDIHTDGKKIIPKEAFSSLVEALEIIENAKKEAKKRIEEANNDYEKIREEAKEKGFNEGLITFNQHILDFNNRIKVLRHELQKAMLPLVLKATKRIIGEATELNPELVVDIVMQSIKGVTQMHRIKLYVNKNDLETLEGAKDQIKSKFEHLDSFVIEERSDVPKGGCMIETERGILNATLDNQFRALERAFETHLKT